MDSQWRSGVHSPLTRGSLPSPGLEGWTQGWTREAVAVLAQGVLTQDGDLGTPQVASPRLRHRHLVAQIAPTRLRPRGALRRLKNGPPYGQAWGGGAIFP